MHLPMILFCIASFAVFVSYQTIPYSLTVLRHRGRDSAAVGLINSGVFQLFIRTCGVDHVIMAGCMLAAMIWPEWGMVMMWVMVAGEMAVASVSVAAALIIYGEAHG